MHFLPKVMQWWIMGKKIRIRRKFESYINKYEDKKHPCYNCLVKGICTDRCDAFYKHDTHIWDNGITLKPILNMTSDGFYSIDYIMDAFSDVKNDMFIKLIKDRKVNRFLKMAKYHQTRLNFILNNHTRKYGYQGSMSSSSISPNWGSTKSAKKKNIIPSKPFLNSQPIHQISKPIPLQKR